MYSMNATQNVYSTDEFGRICIPKSLAAKYGIRPGQISASFKDGMIFLFKGGFEEQCKLFINDLYMLNISCFRPARNYNVLAGNGYICLYPYKSICSCCGKDARNGVFYYNQKLCADCYNAISALSAINISSSEKCICCGCESNVGSHINGKFVCSHCINDI